MRGLHLITLCCVALVSLSSCGTTDKVLVPDPVAPIVRVGYSDAAPDYVLAKLFEQALKTRGVPARLDRIESISTDSGTRNVGPSVTRAGSAGHRAKLTAVASGVVDVVPEYSGQLLFAMNPDASIVQPGIRFNSTSVDSEFDAIFTEMTRSLPQQVRSLRPSTAQRSVVVAVREKDRRLRGFSTISQLAVDCGKFNMIVHAYPEEAVELDHYATTLRKQYRCQPHRSATAATIPTNTDIVIAFASDPILLSEEWKLMQDDQFVLADALMFPLVSKTAINRSRQLILEELCELITTADVQELQRVEYRTPKELDVFIMNWLRKKGYVGIHRI